jgi:3-methyladenine DNA glycosylase AlkD
MSDLSIVQHARRCIVCLVTSEAIVTIEPGSSKKEAQKNMASPTMTYAFVKKRLKSLAQPEAAERARRFFKVGRGEYSEGDRFIGIPVPDLRLLAKEFREAPIAVIQSLLQSPIHEERMLALLILVLRYKKAGVKDRLALFELYLSNLAYVNNWDLVDSSAAQIIGEHLRDTNRNLLSRLAKSKSMWERRIAIVATFAYLRNDDFADALKIAELLVADREDLIHKAVGWVLREIGDRDRQAEIDFLQQHYSTMPRTMLRYAIEKFPEPLRQQYLSGTA